MFVYDELLASALASHGPHPLAARNELAYEDPEAICATPDAGVTQPADGTPHLFANG